MRRLWLRYRAWVLSDAGVAWHGAAVATPLTLVSAVGLNAFAADAAARGDWLRAAGLAGLTAASLTLTFWDPGRQDGAWPAAGAGE